MATGAKIGYGTLFQHGDQASPEVWTTIAEIFSIDGPSLTRNLPDASNMDSPGGFAEFIGGLKDGGEITLGMNFLPNNVTQDASAAGLLGLYVGGALEHFRIQWPQYSPTIMMVLFGVVQTWQPTIPTEDKMTLATTIKVSGQPVLS